MRIDRHTTIEEFAPFAALVTADDMAAVRAAAVRDKFGEAGFYAMTVGDFTTVLGGDPRPLLQSGGRTVYDFCRVEAFRDFVSDDLTAKLKRMTLPPTADTMRLTTGTMSNEFVESVYLFCRSYFGLPSFAAADRLKLSEFMLAKKDDFNRSVVDRNAAAMVKKGGKQ